MSAGRARVNVIEHFLATFAESFATFAVKILTGTV